MKTISAELKAHMAENLATLASCWKIAQVDGTEYFFTAHDKVITFEGDQYEPAQGLMSTAVAQTDGFAVDNAEAITFVGQATDNITETAIAARELDGAAVDLFTVNYEDLTMGALYHLKGWVVGNIEIHENQVRFELRGKAQRLQQTIVELTGPACRADLGDARCGVDIDGSSGGTPFNYTGTVETVTLDRKRFIDTGALADITTSDSAEGLELDVFRFGRLVWLAQPSSGASGEALNEGYEMEIKAFDVSNGEFELFEAMPLEIQVGDPFQAFWGCDKKPDTCRLRFNNIVNFRGEPFIPGFDALQKTATPPKE